MSLYPRHEGLAVGILMVLLSVVFFALASGCDGNTTKWSHIFPGESRPSQLDAGVDGG